jgi:hypothetical protein
MIKLSTNGSQIGGKFDRIEVRGKNVTIKDVTVEGEGITLYSNYNCSGLVVEDSTFISHTNNAVKIIADNVGGIVENVVFRNCKFIGVRMAVEIQNHGKLTPPAEGVPDDWYKIRGVEFEDCTFESDGYALSLSGYGKNARCYNCSFTGTTKGVEVVGFVDVVLQSCQLTGKQAFISSNKRPSKVALRLCKLKGGVRFENCTDSGMAWCIAEASPYVEIKHSTRTALLGCEITSSANYGVMINESRECTVINCKIANTGSNYSVVRCYKPKSTGNIISGNTLMMKKPKVGKWYDQKDGASGNVFENNKQEYIAQKQ